jgi:hypothetical protein
MKRNETVQVETRYLELWVNRLLGVLQSELKLKPIEALFVMKEAAGFIERETGVHLTAATLIPNEAASVTPIKGLT